MPFGARSVSPLRVRVPQSNGGPGLVAAGALRKDADTNSTAPPKPQRSAHTSDAGLPRECALLLAIQFLERLSFHTLKGIPNSGILLCINRISFET